MNTLSSLEKNIITPFRGPSANIVRETAAPVSTNSAPSISTINASNTLTTLDSIQVGWSNYTQGSSPTLSPAQSAFEGATINANFLGASPTRDRILPIGPPEVEPGTGEGKGKGGNPTPPGDRHGEPSPVGDAGHAGSNGESKGKGGSGRGPIGDSSEYSGPVGGYGNAGPAQPKSEEELRHDAIERMRQLISRLFGHGFGGG